MLRHKGRVVDKKDVRIDKMVLNIEGEKISLTMEQAKKLKSLLDELFGKEVVREVIEKHHYHNGWYYRPYGWYDAELPPPPQVTYCSDTNALQVSL